MEDQLEALKRAVGEGGQRKVLITGLGRGGTTAVASMLFHSGFNICGDAEPDKYFEDENLRKLLLDKQYRHLQDELEARVGKFQLVAWKDPKLYSEYGLELVQQMPDDWIIIAVFRDPVAIVSRRMTSDRVDFSDAMPRVIRFMRKLHGFVSTIEKSRKVIYASYEKLITEPISSIEGLHRELGIEINQDIAAHIWMRMRQSQKTYLESEDSKPTRE